MQKTCNSEAAMNAEHGKIRARKLRTRLAELHAAETLAEISRVPPARCHELTGDLKGHLSVDLDYPYRLIIRPDHDPVPERAGGGLDWSAVTAILITDLRDPHR